MIGDAFIEVAYYRVSLDEWAAETEKIRQEWREAALSQMSGDHERASALAMADRHAEASVRTNGHHLGYTYNQVVGWVQVGADGNVVKADAFRIPQARFTKLYRSGKAPPYEYAHGVIEQRFLRSDTPEEIAATVRDALLGLTKRGRLFAGRAPDLDAFDAIAPHLDWRGLLELD